MGGLRIHGEPYFLVEAKNRISQSICTNHLAYYIMIEEDALWEGTVVVPTLEERVETLERRF
jgi:hypothetical protein